MAVGGFAAEAEVVLWPDGFGCLCGKKYESYGEASVCCS